MLRFNSLNTSFWCVSFQENDDYPQDIASSEIANEENSFIGIQSEPLIVNEEDPSCTNATIDVADIAIFTAESEQHSDTINEVLIDGMQCDFVSILK